MMSWAPETFRGDYSIVVCFDCLNVAFILILASKSPEVLWSRHGACRVFVVSDD
jgi:hypothetical protein